MREDGADQSGKRRARARSVEGEIATPAAEVDSRKHQLIAAGGDEALDLAQDGCGGQAARRTARLGNDAEGAAIAAALLNFEVGAGLRAGDELRFFEKGVGEAVVGKHLRCGQLGLRRLDVVFTPDRPRWGRFGWRRLNLDKPVRSLLRSEPAAPGMRLNQAERDLRSEGLVAVADDGGDTGKRGQFLRRALCVAAGGHDARIRIEPVGAADEGAGRAVSLGRDAAGVDHHHIGEGGLALAEAGSAQAIGNCLAIGAGSTAAEVLDVEGSRHSFSLKATEAD